MKNYLVITHPIPFLQSNKQIMFIVKIGWSLTITLSTLTL
uniref:Uncharacterized protein n=1 Tax=Arundo donax TaxID=35708 RepID=A0A0A9A6B5_ARUDO